MLGEESLALARDGVVGVLVDRAARNVKVGQLLVKKPHQGPHQAALCLPLFPHEEHVVPGQNRVDDLGDDAVLVAEDTREEVLPILKGGDQIRRKLGFDTAALPPAGTELGECIGVLVHTGIIRSA